MKIFFAFSTALVLMACNRSPAPAAVQSANATTTTVITDTIDPEEYAAFLAWKSDQAAAAEKEQNRSTAAATRSRTTSTSTRNVSSSNDGGSYNTESSSAAKKSGWSKTAKGAVIGGVVGAGTGAVINKKNRAAGAVVGGVVGAGAGAIIGRNEDRKDGRRQ